MAKACVFDKDGTLVDTESIWFEAYTRLLASYGITHTLEVHRRMMGLAASECIQVLQREHPVLPQGERGLTPLIEAMWHHFRLTREEIGVRLMPGVEEMLHACEARNIPMAIATSATRIDTETELSILGWAKRFQVVVTAEDVARHKPAPDIYLEAVRRLGLESTECMAFEDGINGVKSAHNAGMKVVFVRDERFAIDPPQESDLVIGSFMELLDERVKAHRNAVTRGTKRALKVTPSVAKNIEGG